MSRSAVRATRDLSAMAVAMQCPGFEPIDLIWCFWASNPMAKQPSSSIQNA